MVKQEGPKKWLSSNEDCHSKKYLFFSFCISLVNTYVACLFSQCHWISGPGVSGSYTWHGGMFADWFAAPSREPRHLPDQPTEKRRENAEINCVPVCMHWAEKHLVSNQRGWGERIRPYSLSTPMAIVLRLGRKKFISTAPAAELFYLNRRIQLETVTWFLRLQLDERRLRDRGWLPRGDPPKGR